MLNKWKVCEILTYFKIEIEREFNYEDDKATPYGSISFAWKISFPLLPLFFLSFQVSPI